MSDCTCMQMKAQCEFCKMMYNSKIRNPRCIIHANKFPVNVCPRCGN